MKERIRTFNELKQKQDRLKLQAEVSKQLFFESFGNTRRHATDFVLKGVILPIGAAGVAAWGAKKLFHQDNGRENIDTYQSQEKEENKTGNVGALISQFMPIGLSLLNAYFTKQLVKDEVEE